MLKISARNQLKGTVTKIETGKIHADIWIDIGDDNTIFSNITRNAVEELDLALGDQVMAIIKSSSVILSLSDQLQISARNRLKGRIRSIEKGAVNSEVGIALPNGEQLTANLTSETAEELGLKINQDCLALIKASQVIIAKEG